MGNKVTDPALLAQLDGGPKPVSDPALLAQLNAGSGPTTTESLGRGAAQGATLGFGDEIQGLLQAAGIKHLPSGLGGGTNAPLPWTKEFWDKNTPGGFFSSEGVSPSPTDQRGMTDLYREQRDVARNDDAAAQKANPKSYLAGELTGGVLPSVATSGAGAAAGGLSIGQRLLAAAKIGAAYGGATSLGDSKADLTKGDVAGAAKDTAKGAALGAGVSAGLTGAGALLKKAITGAVQLDPANTFLRSKGVRDLTLGQAAPKSWFNSVEQAAESLPVIGDTIKAQRQAGRASWQRAVLNEARAPGAAEVAGSNPADTLAKVADTFDAAYRPIAALPAEASVSAAPGRFAAPGAKLPLSTALQEAAADPSVRATDDVRKSVASFLDNAHSELATTAQQRPLTAGDLISVRSQIRSEIRSELAGSNPDYAAARLLKNAEDAVSGSLQQQLPPDAAAALQATDAQYAKLMRVTDAVRRAGDQPGGFTAAQLSAAVKSGAEKNSYAQGGGGALRELAAAGRQTLDTTSPPTGARLLTLGLGTAALPVTAGLAAGATTDIGKKLLTGGTAPQLAGRVLLDAIAKRKLALETARRAALIGSTEAAQ